MPKKKRVKKKANVKPAVSGGNRFKSVFRRFVFFLIFFVLFLVLYFATSKEMWVNFFGLAAIIFGFISVALLLTLLVLWFLKLMKK